MQSLFKKTSIHYRARTSNPKICMESLKTPDGQSNHEKEKQTWTQHDTGFQSVLQGCSHQDGMVLSEKQAHRSMEENREPKNGPRTVWSTNLQKSRKNI